MSAEMRRLARLPTICKAESRAARMKISPKSILPPIKNLIKLTLRSRAELLPEMTTAALHSAERSQFQTLTINPMLFLTIRRNLMQAAL